MSEFAETLLNFYQTTRRHVPSNTIPHSHSQENLKSYTVKTNYFKTLSYQE